MTLNVSRETSAHYIHKNISCKISIFYVIFFYVTNFYVSRYFT